MTNEFKIGDKVRIIRTDYGDQPSQNIGQIRIVMEIDENGVDLDFSEGKEQRTLYYFFSEVEPYSEPIKKEEKMNLHEINAYATVGVEPFSIETPNGCTARVTGPFGDIRFEVDNELCWDVEDLRYLAATLNHLADKIEEAKNA